MCRPCGGRAGRAGGAAAALATALAACAEAALASTHQAEAMIVTLKALVSAIALDLGPSAG